MFARLRSNTPNVSYAWNKANKVRPAIRFYTMIALQWNNEWISVTIDNGNEWISVRIDDGNEWLTVYFVELLYEINRTQTLDKAGKKYRFKIRSCTLAVTKGIHSETRLASNRVIRLRVKAFIRQQISNKENVIPAPVNTPYTYHWSFNVSIDNYNKLPHTSTDNHIHIHRQTEHTHKPYQ